MNGVDTVEQIFRNSPCFTISGISLLVAEISRISTGITLLLPIRRHSGSVVQSIVWLAVQWKGFRFRP